MRTWGFRLSRGWSRLGRFGRDQAEQRQGGGAGDWIGPESAGAGETGHVGGVWIGVDNPDTLAVVDVVICLIL
jgi:hypothetical protein